MMRQIFAIILLCFNLEIFHCTQQPEKSEPSHEANQAHSNNSRSFVIDYEHDVFLKDGKPFRYVAGSFHYFRAPRPYWRDRLRKLRAAGLTAVTTYVEWSSHEPYPGNYQFSGDNDVEYFIQLAMEEDLLVILRPGPYICAERDYGGFPPWLMTNYPEIKIRTNDTIYENQVKKWFDVLFGKLTKYLYGNGGPIIMVQVENEYGSYYGCNTTHKLWLRDEMRRHVRDAAVLFTTDIPENLACGSIPGVYATIDFGPNRDAREVFAKMRHVQPHGPLVNSEFYPGWLSHWEEPMARVHTLAVVNAMKHMLDMKASFNFYMFYGGTNFGFKNGANFNENTKEYQPQLTSYDYDAPLDEAGDTTEKYFAIRDLISKYYQLPNISVPETRQKANYGSVKLEAVCSAFNYTNIKDKVIWKSAEPKTFEFLNTPYGYVLYQTVIPKGARDPALLHISDFRDRAIVYLDEEPVGILDRRRNISSLPLLTPPGRTLSLLVENQGRINYGNYMGDKKGIISEPLLDNYPLGDWTMVGLPFENISWVYDLPSASAGGEICPPAVYVGKLVLPPETEPSDTYVDLTGWGKGVIFVNDFNLGRYWPSTGPQVTLYVPGTYLRPHPQKNDIVVFETEYVPNSREIKFTDRPFLDKVPPKIH